LWNNAYTTAIGAGVCIFSGNVELYAPGNLCGLDLGANPAITVQGNLTIDLDSTGDVILDASSNPITLRSDLINEITGAGTFTADSQDLLLDGTNDQDINGCGGTWGTVEIDKTAGTVTLSATLTCGALTGTDGDLDISGETITCSGAVSFASGFTLADLVGSTIECDTIAFDGQDLDASGAWTLTAATSGTISNATISNCDASGGVEIDASDGTCIDGGGNDNINFGVTAPGAWDTPYAIGAYGAGAWR